MLYFLFYSTGGLILVPLIGNKGTLLLGCFVFAVAPLLTYFTLNTNILGITCTYGILSASSAIMLVVPLTIIPVTWFPNHRGRVIGIVASGFGFSSFIFVPIETLLINPGNVKPVLHANSSSSYFRSTEVLDNLPPAFLYLGALYSCFLFIGNLFTFEKSVSNQQKNSESNLLIKLRYGSGLIAKSNT